MNAEMKTLYAYCDESGNTGAFINDPNQPILTYSAVISESDLDSQTFPEISAACRVANVPYLHGKKIDKKDLPECCAILLPLLKRLGIHFFSCVINKADFAKLKLFDMFFDSGLNPYSSNLHYGVRTHRLILSSNFIQAVSDKHSREFWDFYLKGDFVKMREVVGEIFDYFCAATYLDSRTRELIIDTLDFYMENSERFHESMVKEFNSPNIAGFALLIQSLHEHYGDVSFRIAEVKHDIQDEFSKEISFLFNTQGQWESNRSPFSLISDISRSQLLPPEIKFEQSRNSVGIQLTDFISYLMQLKEKKKLPDSKEIRKFLGWVENNVWRTGVSAGLIHAEVRRILADLSKKKPSAAAIATGMDLLKKIEARRKLGIEPSTT